MVQSVEWKGKAYKIRMETIGPINQWRIENENRVLSKCYVS